MTTDTEELEAPEPASDEAAADESATAGPGAGAEEEPIPFWQRPNVDRYIAPLLLPVMVVFGVIAFVLSVSRIFLSEHGNTPVVIGTAITVLILIGAIVLSSAPAMRSASVALIGGGFFMLILFAGWLSLGHAEPVEENVALAPEGPSLGDLTFDATDALTFVPDSADAETGIWTITLTDSGGDHTFDFDATDTGLGTLVVNAPGDSATGRAFFPEAADYTFYCGIAGHRAAGMEGVITVTGDPKTLEQAQAEVGDTGAGAEGGAPAEGGGETPAS